MSDLFPYDIHFLKRDDWEDAISLTWRTFLEFEAPDYPTEGVSSFENFITDTALKRMFELGLYQVMAAYAQTRIVGVISLRGESHISLLFVDKKYHHQGIASNLIYEMKRYAKEELGREKLTVNASPYATEFYHKVGFVDTDICKKQDGIIFTPMELIL